jgi:ABC-type glycerol-3-phosphate transport system permease component
VTIDSTENRRAGRRKRVVRGLALTVLIVTAILLVLPIVTLFITSLKLDSEYNRWPITFFPKVAQWVNYERVFEMTSYGKYMVRTILLGIIYACIITTTSALAGYGFARYRVPASRRLFVIVVAMLIIPGIVLTIPQFILYARLRLTNTYWPWILGALAASPFFIFLFRQFFLTFPRELEEAAEVDGAGPLRIFAQIFVPNSQAVIATVMFFAFAFVWGDYLTPLIYLNDSKMLLPVVLQRNFRNPQNITIVTVASAAAILYILPPIIVFFIAQKQILKGVVMSGIKG